MEILSGLAKDQVLQRLGSQGATVRLRGTSTEKGPLWVTLSKSNAALKGWKKRLVGRIVRGKFSVKLSSIPVGGPYRLRLEAGKQRVDISPFFVGDVWILAGQSNMQGIGDMSGAAWPHPLVRAFSMRREWRLAKDPLHVLEESPDVCHVLLQCSPEQGETLRRQTVKGTGVGLFFAREMVERSGGVPQGLICAAHGGTTMQQWSPDRKNLGAQSLYASLLTSVRATAQPVSGLLWYQGESDANPDDAAQYTPRMKKLVAASRRDLRQPRLPWMIVQLARLFSEPADPRAWNSLQEQQRLLPEKIKFFETLPAIDLPLDDAIHIGSAGFPLLATRLAGAADRLVYGNRHEIRTPQLRGIRRLDRPPLCTVEVVFDFVRGGLRASGEPGGFKFVSPEGVPLDILYKTELKGNKVKLHRSPSPIRGARLCYGHGFSPSCNITDARGFSLPVFAPVPIDPGWPKATMPFVIQWRVTGIVPISVPLDQVPLPNMASLDTTIKTYPQNGPVSEQTLWESKSGHAFFHSRLLLSEPMTLEFLMGYDGPFRLWLDGKPFFKNRKGTNPCFPDESGKIAKLEAGAHDLHVGMDLNNGLAWGFFLRFARRDVTKEQIRTGEFVKPAYSV